MRNPASGWDWGVGMFPNFSINQLITWLPSSLAGIPVGAQHLVLGWVFPASVDKRVLLEAEKRSSLLDGHADVERTCPDLGFSLGPGPPGQCDV